MSQLRRPALHAAVCGFRALGLRRVLMFMFCAAMAAQCGLAARGTVPAPQSPKAVRRPTTAIAQADCITAECHAEVKRGPVVHGPVAAAACDSCHELTDAAKHAFRVRREKAELCTYCHEFSVKGMPVIHKPVAEGQCLGCHDPHGGETRGLLLEKTMAGLCNRCHESVTRDKPFAHGPVAQGACETCHPPHAAKFPKLLDVVGSDMCLACHKEMAAGVSGTKSTHKALEQGCEKCHDVHASRTPMELRQAVPDLCLDCHKKLKETIAAASVPHSVATRERSCLTCHVAHGSNLGKLLNAAPAVTCLKCHDKPVQTAAGKTIDAVPEIANPKLVKHGEIRDGQCSGCHDVHGGQREFLLVKLYTEGLYQKFSPEAYALCFGCHDVQLAKEATTRKATDFRNGNQNLHVSHVATGVLERTCGTCHLTHAGRNKELVRSTLVYNKWLAPMGFAATATGGSCDASCHASYAYDRQHAVPATAPATRPAAALRAEHEEARVVRWSTQDARGAAVKVPDAAGRPTLLVFPPAESATEKAFVERLLQAVLRPTDVQVVIVLSGPAAGKRAAALARAQEGSPAPARVVVDEKGEALETLDVRGRPLAIVLGSDGLEMVRLSGDATLLALKLPAYLPAPAGAVASATGPGSAASQAAAEDRVEKRAERDLRIARTLLEENRAAEALNFLDRDAAPSGPSQDTQMLRVEALLQLKRSADALAILDRVPAGAGAPAQLTLLRATALIAQEKWDPARTILEEFVARLPNSAEAHRLLGQVYEHEENWPKATEQYRLASERRGKEDAK